LWIDAAVPVAISSVERRPALVVRTAVEVEREITEEEEVVDWEAMVWAVVVAAAETTDPLAWEAALALLTIWADPPAS